MIWMDDFTQFFAAFFNRLNAYQENQVLGKNERGKFFRKQGVNVNHCQVLSCNRTEGKFYPTFRSTANGRIFSTFSQRNLSRYM